MNSITQKDIDRFWGKVDKDSSCIFYKGTQCWIIPSKQRYASIWFLGRYLKAHRIAWIISYGNIRNGLSVLHHCDNTHCVNPNHLFLGTQLENIYDMISKGRKWIGSGEDNGNCKLSDKQVDEIRKLYIPYSHKYNIKKLAQMYSISRTQVCSIVNYKTRKKTS